MANSRRAAHAARKALADGRKDRRSRLLLLYKIVTVRGERFSNKTRTYKLFCVSAPTI